MLKPASRDGRSFLAIGDIESKLRDRLLNSEWATPKTRVGEKYITGLRCPACGHVEAWAYFDRPYTIICNRANNCGVRTKTLELFPDVLKRVERDYPPTDTDPHRPAREYLLGRGLRTSLEGLDFRYIRTTRKNCGGGVGFPLGKLDADGRPIILPDSSLNIRLFDPPPDEGKTHNAGQLEDLYWVHPGKPCDLTKPVYITEGVIDALALWEMGRQAVSVISAGRDPEKVALPTSMRIVLAFDNDAAGRSAFLRWKKRFPGAEVVTPPDKAGDWNEVLIAHGEEAADYFSKNETRFRQEAEILSAPNACEYANRFKQYHNHPAGIFELDGATYFAPNGGVTEVGDFTVGVEHFRLDRSNADQMEFHYRLRVTPRGEQTKTFTATASDLAGTEGLVRLFLEHAKVLWKGNKAASMALLEKIVSSGAPTVRQLSAIGYDEGSKSYVFRHFRITPDGEQVLPNKHGIFELSARDALRPANLKIPTLNPEEGISARDIFRAIHAAWGIKAAVAVAFVAASWFIDKVKGKLQWFPFLSFYGDPSSGKTFLVTTMNNLQCLDEEGLAMNRVNTAKGELRTLAQISGMSRALLEGNKEKSARFDFDQLLTMYNDSPLQVRAQKSNDNLTILMEWKGALILVQNQEPLRTVAQKSRVVSMKFLDTDIDDTKEAFARVQAMKKAHLAHFFVEVMRQRRKFETEWYDRYLKIYNDLKAEIPDDRIRGNHAIILAFYDILREILGLEIDIRSYVVEIAKEKIKACRHHVASLADFFFQTLDLLPSEKRDRCVAFDRKGKMHVFLPVALKLLREEDLLINPNQTQLYEALREHPAFIDDRHSSRKFQDSPGSAPKRIWLFDPEKLVPEDGSGDDDATDGEDGEGEEDDINEDLRGAPMD